MDPQAARAPWRAGRAGTAAAFAQAAQRAQLYDGVPHDVFVYDGNDVAHITDFATSSSIQVMIINIGAFNKSFTAKGEEDKSNIFHRRNEKLPNGRSPQQLVSECNPVVIIDEPQSVDNTAKAKKAIASLNPLFVLRYSATHKEPYNRIYELGPVQAFQQDLVKGIRVDSVQADANLNGAYMRLESVKPDHSSARVTIDVKQDDGSQKRKPVTIRLGSDLFELSHDNSDYADTSWIVTNIDSTEGNEFVDFQNDERLYIGAAKNDVDAALVKRAQIRQTIEDHLEKQLEMLPLGVKVLSLFFIDEVAKYREYDDEGIRDGEYARMFDEEYRRLVTSPKWKDRYARIADVLPLDPTLVRTGYFSKDKKNRFKNTSSAASTQADTDTFELIMRDKETLLSLPDGKDPRKQYSFIFSHSALKEGWDNPNVFQICTLVETRDTLTKRQKIGRGLRLCVNQDGQRLHDPQANVLTVIANESYGDFANGLQREFTKEGYRFGVLTPESFSNLTVVRDGKPTEERFGFDNSRTVYDHLLKEGLIDDKGTITPELKRAITDGTLDLPDEIEPMREQIEQVIMQRAAKLPVKDKAKEIAVTIRQDVYENPAFQELWQRIRQRSRFRLDVNTGKLVEHALKRIKDMARITPVTVRNSRTDLDIDMAGISTSDVHQSIVNVSRELQYSLPDPISELQDIVGLTRRTLKDILERCGRLDEYPIDPATFITQVAAAIKDAKTEVLAAGIIYTKLPEEDWYDADILQPTDGAKGYLGQNAYLPTHLEKWLYDCVVYDSATIELPYAKQLDSYDDVVFCTKLPATFVVETPFGPYNPDWAYVREQDGGTQRVYLVVETKGGANGQAVTRPGERRLIAPRPTSARSQKSTRTSNTKCRVSSSNMKIALR